MLLDVVIGYGSHEDPAGHLVTSLGPSLNNSTLVIASVTGTDGDPQGRITQITKLEKAGILVAPSNSDAVELAIGCLKLPG